jgi:methylglyoxal synthase
MEYKNVILPAAKSIALVAHDNRKKELLAWCKLHREQLKQHSLYATGTTGSLIEQELGLPITKLISGPMGGDQQVGALITENKINMLIFFWDPFEPLPHDPDVKALIRIAAVWNIPIACNQTSADFMIASPLFSRDVSYAIPDYAAYMAKRVKSVV